MNKILIAGVLATTSVFAQLTGDWGRTGRAGMMDGMYGGTGLHMILWTIFSIGLILLVWLWVFKLWKEIKRMK